MQYTMELLLHEDSLMAWRNMARFSPPTHCPCNIQHLNDVHASNCWIIGLIVTKPHNVDASC